jgi:hypothetical protein
MPASALSAAELPDDVEALKRLVLSQAAREQAYETEIARLREQLNLLLAKRYGPSSEKLSPDPFGLFNEAEAEAETPRGGERRSGVRRRPRAQAPRAQAPAGVPASGPHRARPAGSGKDLRLRLRADAHR